MDGDKTTSGNYRGITDRIKVKFYRVFNCLYVRSKAAHSELVTVKLIKSYCLPLILYAIEVMPLSATYVRVLEIIVLIDFCTRFLVLVMQVVYYR